MSFSWLLSEGRTCEIFVKLSGRYPQKRRFSWLLSEEFFRTACNQINFWKNVKVFTCNCRVIMRGLFYKVTQSPFRTKKIFVSVYILKSRVLGYIEEFREKSINFLANPRTDIRKVSFI